MRILPAFNPVFSIGIAQGLPPVIPVRNERLSARNSERTAGLPTGWNKFGYGLAVAGDDHSLTILNQSEEPWTRPPEYF